jgi:hypothetical protein
MTTGSPGSYGLGPNNDGWHTIEIRMSNGVGGQGATGSNGWPANFGFGLAQLPGYFATNNNGALYYVPIDPGNASLFRTVTPSSLVTSGAGRVVFSGATSAAVALAVNGGEAVFSGGGTAANLTALTVAAGAKLTLDNTGTNGTDRLADTTPIALNGGTLAFVGGAAGSTETVGPVTLGGNATSTVQSTTTGTGAAGTMRASVTST